MERQERKVGRWKTTGRTLLFLLCNAVVLAAVGPFAQGWSGPLAVGAVASVVTFLLTLFFVRWDGIGLRDVGVALTRGSVARFFVAFVLGLVLPVLYAVLKMAGSHVRYVRTGEFDLAAVLLALTTYVALACREEMAFRGYPLFRLEAGFGGWTAQLIIALVFGTEHMEGGWSLRQAMLGAAVGSILFGAAALATRGLAAPIGLHAAWNFGQWVLSEKESPGLWRMVAEEGARRRVEIFQTMSYLAVMALGTLAVVWWARRMGSRLSA